jgi:hypothetical protein
MKLDRKSLIANAAGKLTRVETGEIIQIGGMTGKPFHLKFLLENGNA